MSSNKVGTYLRKTFIALKWRSVVKGYVEHVHQNQVKGWAIDIAHSENPLKIRVLLERDILIESTAHIARPDVATILGIDKALCGFDISINIASGDLEKITVEAGRDGKNWEKIDRLKQPAFRSYQDFDGTGDSKSHEKLKALKLYDLNAGISNSREPLYGKRVLDIGCNEGFFCAESVRQGASRVLGIDKDQKFIERAKKRVPSADFLNVSWWDIPDEKFDIIFFLSAIHYETDQKRLLDKLAGHLTDDGVLILECGVKGGGGRKQWHLVQRWDGERRYPSLDFLRDDLLSKYAVRGIGPSVDQVGDPVPRFVYHCRLRHPVALIILGKSHSGKTTLANGLSDRGIPHYDTDSTIAKLLIQTEFDQLPLAQKLRIKFEKKYPSNMALVGNYISETDIVKDFIDFISKEIPCDTNLFMIEGEILRHKNVQNELFSSLLKIGVRAWTVERGN